MKCIAALLVAGLMLYAQNTAPRVISRVDPEYSEEAILAQVNALVDVGVIVASDGVPVNPHVLRGAGFGLDEKAIEAVRQWRFQPGTKGGEAATMPARIEVSFQMIAQGHEGQVARLDFSIPPGRARPQLIKGRLPANPAGGGAQNIRIAIAVGAEGTPTAVSVLESTSSEWSAQALRDIAAWQFTPGTINNQPWEMKGVLELKTTGASAIAQGTATAPGSGDVGQRMVLIVPPEPQDATLRAPVLTAPLNLSEFNVYPRRTAFTWEPAPGAVSYILEWDYSHNGQWNAEVKKMPGAGFATTGTEYSFDFVGAQPGRWRVWPVNAAGQRGMPSEWRTFRYIR